LTEIEVLINRVLPQFDAPWVVKRNLPEPVDVVQPVAAGAVVEEEPLADGKPIIPKRYKEVIRRCEILEQHGIQPLRRTLASRFRSPRRR
jgi:hypothetical protein